MKTITKILFLFSLQIVAGVIQAQTNSPYLAESKLIIQSENKKGNYFEAVTNNSYMMLNTSSGDFILNFDAINLKTTNPKLDSVLISKGSQKITFKGNMSENLFLFNQQINDEKMYNIQGQLSVNNVIIDCVAQFDPVNYSDKDAPKSYRIDFKLTVDASKVIILGLENKINKQFIIEVKGGKINIQQ